MLGEGGGSAGGAGYGKMGLNAETRVLNGHGLVRWCDTSGAIPRCSSNGTELNTDLQKEAANSIDY